MAERFLERFFQALTQTQYQWLYFGLMLFAISMSALGVFAWIKYAPKRRKRKRKHHGHGRINPTRAQIGGLPAVRRPEDQDDAENPPFDPLA
jgi:hypothetical protein